MSLHSWPDQSLEINWISVPTKDYLKRKEALGLKPKVSERHLSVKDFLPLEEAQVVKPSVKETVVTQEAEVEPETETKAKKAKWK